MVEVESHFIALPEGRRLHLKRFKPGPPPSSSGQAVLLVHGAIENGRIFHSSSGKGLAPFLAQAGHDVYVLDLGGRGESTPPIGPGSAHGQNESIREELPAAIREVARLSGGKPQHWGAHSWGGVLLLSVWARFPELRPHARSLFFFATKRSILQFNLEILWKVKLFWNTVGRLIAAWKGYLPARAWGFGSDDETRLSHLESVRWVKRSPWTDTRDGFEYGKALAAAEGELPPLLFLTGAADRCLGHPGDVRTLIRETGAKRFKFEVLGRFAGNAADYGHVDILTHPAAAGDHFPRVDRWIRGGE